MSLFTQQDRLKAIELARSGKTLQEIANLFGTSRQTIYNWVRSIPNKERGASLRSSIKEAERLQERVEKIGSREWYALSDKDKARRLFWSRKKQNTKRTGWEWNLKWSDVEWVDVCPILGITLDWFNDMKSENSPSLDRLDPKKGYIPGNVCLMSWRANRIKNDGSAEEHRKIAEFLERIP